MASNKIKKKKNCIKELINQLKMVRNTMNLIDKYTKTWLAYMLTNMENILNKMFTLMVQLKWIKNDKVINGKWSKKYILSYYEYVKR